jgi:hypothetical protein
VLLALGSFAFVGVALLLVRPDHPVFVWAVATPFFGLVGLAHVRRAISKAPMVRIDTTGILLDPAFVAWPDVQGICIYSFRAYGVRTRFLGVVPRRLRAVRIRGFAPWWWLFALGNNLLRYPPVNLEQKMVDVDLEALAGVIKRDHDVPVLIEPE